MEISKTKMTKGKGRTKAERPGRDIQERESRAGDKKAPKGMPKN